MEKINPVQDNNGILWIGLEKENCSGPNLITLEFMDCLRNWVDIIKNDPKIKAVIIYSKNPSGFIAGVDIQIMQRAKNEKEVIDIVNNGYDLLSRIQKLKKPVIAAINGHCLGGGGELALSCHYRLMSDNPRSFLSWPEIKIGLFPAWKGIELIRKLTSLPEMLDIILTGKNIYPRQALKYGLVDAVVPEGDLLRIANQWAMDLINGKFKKMKRGRTITGSFRQKINQVLGLPLVQKLTLHFAKRRIDRESLGLYKAPYKILEVVSASEKEFRKKNSEELARLLLDETSRNLRDLFFRQASLKDDGGFSESHSIETPQIKEILVLGAAGFMGSAISTLFPEKTNLVHLKDVDPKLLASGFSNISKIIIEKNKKRLGQAEIEKLLSKLRPLDNWSGVEEVNFVLEAVIENLSEKRGVLSEFEKVNKGRAVFASNTSTIPIAEIAKDSNYPEKVCGMHFFSPADKMPLVEIIKGEKTSLETIAIAINLAKRIGKIPIVANDNPGFLINFILMPYIAEAGYLLLEGASIDEIDRSIRKFGMAVDSGHPMGPLELLDFIGIETSYHVAKKFEEETSQTSVLTKLLEQMVDSGMKGRKNKEGFYSYQGKGQKPNDEIYKLITKEGERKISAEEITERCLLMILSQSVRALELGIIGEPKDITVFWKIDLAMVLGVLFPAFRGGPLTYLQKLGIENVYKKMLYLAKTVGERFSPPEFLKEMVEKKLLFYDRYD